MLFSQCETRPCTGIGGLSFAALMLYLIFKFEVYRTLISIFIGFQLLCVCVCVYEWPLAFSVLD